MTNVYAGIVLYVSGENFEPWLGQVLPGNISYKRYSKAQNITAVCESILKGKERDEKKTTKIWTYVQIIGR